MSASDKIDISLMVLTIVSYAVIKRKDLITELELFISSNIA
jgi:hypothetical protein